MVIHHIGGGQNVAVQNRLIDGAMFVMGHAVVPDLTRSLGAVVTLGGVGLGGVDSLQCRFGGDGAVWASLHGVGFGSRT